MIDCGDTMDGYIHSAEIASSLMGVMVTPRGRNGLLDPRLIFARNLGMEVVEVIRAEVTEMIVLNK
jgi:hypothetical protein